MEALTYPELFELQDKVLSTVFGVETTFYLTGETCLHRFHYERRLSKDLDLFTNENSASLSYTPQVDARDFVRLWIHPGLQIDLVNDRVYRYGRSIHSPNGIVLDNEVNICANKICAILGRDDPKDMFDLYTAPLLLPFGAIGSACSAERRCCQ